MRNIDVKEWFHIGDDLVAQVSWWDKWENSIGEIVINRSLTYKIIDIQRNRCSGFFFGSDEEWNKRDLYLKVESV